LGLQIPEVAVADREAFEQLSVELRRLVWIDRDDAVLFVGQPAPHQAPLALALFEKIIKSADAEHVADHTLDRGALRDRHLGLRDGALALDLDRGPAEEMVDTHAALVAVEVGDDELLIG